MEAEEGWGEEGGLAADAGVVCGAWRRGRGGTGGVGEVCVKGSLACSRWDWDGKGEVMKMV